MLIMFCFVMMFVFSVFGGVFIVVCVFVVCCDCDVVFCDVVVVICVVCVSWFVCMMREVCVCVCVLVWLLGG